MPININQFRAAAASGEDKVVVAKNEQVLTKGTGLGGRIVEWLRSKMPGGSDAKLTENAQTKSEFIAAIRKEYGDAMADRAHYEVNKDNRLSARTVLSVLKNADSNREGFVKLHNLRAATSIEKQVNKLMGRLGGLEALYQSQQEPLLETFGGHIQSRFGLELPPFDSVTFASVKKDLISDQLASGIRTNQDSGLYTDPKSELTKSDVLAAMEKALLRSILLKEGGLSNDLQSKLLKGDDHTTHVANLMESIINLANQEPASKVKLALVVGALFEHAQHEQLHDVSKCLVKMGVANDLLSIEKPGVAGIYEN